MTNKKTSGVRTCDHAGESIRTSDSMVNLVKGVVHSQQVGLIQTTVRICAGRRGYLRVKLVIDDERCFFAGQQVIALIPAEAVRLESGLYRRSKQHLNRWCGRIVLIEPSLLGHVITAKVHGESWALKCTGPIVGASRPPPTWDPVNIVVDPQAIELVPGQEKSLLELDAWNTCGY